MNERERGEGGREGGGRGGGREGGGRERGGRGGEQEKNDGKVSRKYRARGSSKFTNGVHSSHSCPMFTDHSLHWNTSDDAKCTAWLSRPRSASLVQLSSQHTTAAAIALHTLHEPLVHRE